MVDDGVHVMILCRCMRYEGYSATIIVQVLLRDSKFISDFGIKSLAYGLWLMATNPPGEALQQILSRYKPGQMLLDQQGRYWVRQAKTYYKISLH